MRRKRIHLNVGFGSKLDADETFVVRQCATYLQRHLEGPWAIEEEAIKVLYWVLGKDREELGRRLLQRLKGAKRREFEEELMDAHMDDEDYVDAVARMVRKAPPSTVRRFEAEVLDLLERRIETLEGVRPSDMEKNLGLFQQTFHLSDREIALCTFLFIASTYKMAEDFFVDYLGCGKHTGRKRFANILGMRLDELHEVLIGTLKKIDAFEIDPFEMTLKEEYLDLILNPANAAVFENFYSRLSGDLLPLEHHFRLVGETECVLKLLERKPETSTHILLYGPPGTGKSSFARGIAGKLGIPAYEIARDNENTSSNRRAAILACLNMTNNGPGSLVLVDEADNVLHTKFSWFRRGETQDKGWLNQLMETPGVRMIWIVNEIEDVEESVLRRFALSLRFRPFGRRQRIQLWDNIARRNKAKRYLGRTIIEEMAFRHDAGAGAIDLALKKAMEANLKSARDFRSMVKMLLEAHQTLLNAGEKRINKDAIEKSYSVEGLNIQGDLHSMMGSLERLDQHLRQGKQKGVMNMNLLFYGPPGSGKSELARFLAGNLDREVLCWRVSDLQSHYVGMSEKNIKEAFAAAEAGEAILIIDEADSLLFSRDRAHHSWEISFTNEFLTQMEKFRGILICTTNRLSDLDEASLRRFSHKIGFRTLEPEGNILFYERLLGPLASGPLSEDAAKALRGVTNLCPGDFKAVRDRFAFHPRYEVNHDMLVEALVHEARLKHLHTGRKAVGF